MRKILLFSIALIQITLIHAQMRGQGQGMVMPEFNANNAAGILNYDDEAVIKKLKISDEIKKNTISNAIDEYNLTIDEIKFLNSDKLAEIEKSVKTKQEFAMASRDREAMFGVQEEAREKIQPIKKQVNIATEKLNKKLEQILTEKQYKKWLKYQSSKKAALKPKQKMGGSSMSRGMGQRGQHGQGGGRMGGMGF